MSINHTRRAVALSMLAAPFAASVAKAQTGRRVSIRDAGAVSDGKTINTAAIQKAIDQMAARGGGTIVVPAGVFVSGALFLKPKVNLHLEKYAVIRAASDDVAANFPAMRTRIEGHFEDAFTPALINAKACHGLKITGEGVFDGAGKPVWDAFFKARREFRGPGAFANIAIPRARLALIEDCKGVTVEGVTFKDSQFWNLHLYRCQDVMVRKARFEVPDDVEAPSSDGIDLDSCQRVVIDGCYFSVTDDCIASKGSKGPFALEDKDSPPVENIRIRNCNFRRGHNGVTCGSEATIVRDVLVENCQVSANMVFVMLKLRPDTPQTYENIHFRNITFDNPGGRLIYVAPWTQYRDLKGQPPPKATVRNLSFTGFKGKFGMFGSITPNVGQTTISDITFKDFDVELPAARAKLGVAEGVTNVKFDNVKVNGAVATL